VIDARGRVFGRVNLIDAAVTLLIASVTACGAIAFVVIRPRPPIVTRVVPQTLAAGTPSRLHLDGRDFRPYLRAAIVSSGGTLPVASAPILLGTTRVAELPLPPLSAGAYDIRIYDGGREIAVCERAFIVVSDRAHES
jgi:hypothetical protein